MKGIQLLQMYQTVLSDRAKENTESSERSSRLLVTPLWFVLISETTLNNISFPYRYSITFATDAFTAGLLLAAYSELGTFKPSYM